MESCVETTILNVNFVVHGAGKEHVARSNLIILKLSLKVVGIGADKSIVI